MISSFRRKGQALFIASLLIAGSAPAFAEVLSATCAAQARYTGGVVINGTPLAPEPGGFLNAKDQDGLEGKAEGAAMKIEKLKLNDALTILDAMRAQVNSLMSAAKPKLDRAAGSAINTEIGYTIDCINSLKLQAQL